MSTSEQNKSKQQIIDERQANLPLPEQPPAASDFNSADARTTAVGSGAVSGDSNALREPFTGDSSVRTDGDAFKVNTEGQKVGREAVDGLGGIPNDAVTRDAKDKSGLADTTGKDYGYPQKNDPADTSKLH